MNDVDKIRLAIYEDKTLSDKDKEILLEATDEEKVSSNKIYINAYRKAATQYKNDIKEVKSLINDKELRKALKKLKETRTSLDELEKLVKDTPSTLTDTLLSQMIEISANVLVGFAICKALEPAFKRLNEHYKKEYEEMKKLFPDKKIPKPVSAETGSSIFKSALIESIGWVGFKDLYSTLKTHDPVSNTNLFKNRALKKISKEKKLLDKLEKAIMRFV